MPSPAISLSVAAVLAAYLCVSVWRRHRAEAEKRRAWEKEWLTRPLDASQILAQVEELRSNAMAAAHARSRYALTRRGLVASARNIVAHLSYFARLRQQNRDHAEHETHKHMA